MGKGNSRPKGRIRRAELSPPFSRLRSSGDGFESPPVGLGPLAGTRGSASEGFGWYPENARFSWLGSAGDWTDSTGPFRHVSMVMSEKDAKIIRLMAERRESQIQDEKSALAAHSIWEKEKLAEEKKSKEKKKQLAEYLEKKRETERFLHSLKKDRIIKNLNEEAIHLENKIADELEKAQNRQHLLLQKKMERLKKWSDYRSQVRQIIQQEKAEIDEMEKTQRLAAVEAKERTCLENLSRLCLETKRRSVSESEKRRLRWEAAKTVREEAHTKLLQSRFQNLQFNIKNDQIRTQNAIKVLESRKKITHEYNLTKKHHHDLLLNKVIEDNQQKIQQIKAKILQEDLKSQAFKQKLNMGISKGKIYARTTANLRQKIQASYTL